ncbi:Sulfite oxidase and related enzyme [alpha proteobacterium BAL199]|jgi:DMSO/TMAO reductase YedYZ molybdopterin-dependent catalytic subunit|nr:Sulfite oxidase and related enzyme [alpha proteobacterium BAL199]
MNDGPMIPADRAKLVERKTAWARERRAPTGRAGDPEARRLPPGQQRVRDFPVLDLGTHPNLNPRDWRLSVEGLVSTPTVFSLADIEAIPPFDVTADIHCVTAWSRLDNRWRGVATRDLIAEVRPHDDAKFVIVKSYDGYTTNLSIDWLYETDSLIATHWEGKPLTREHGGPARLVIPALYFWKSAKWVRSIRFVARDVKGFWEARGYHGVGDPWKEQRYG